MIVYNKFFELAHAKNLSIEQLRKMLTPRTVYRLENNAEISRYTLSIKYAAEWIASRVILWNMWKMMNTDINVKLFYSI